MFITIKELREEYNSVARSNLMNLCLDINLLPKILKHYPKCFDTELISINKCSQELKYEIIIPCFPNIFTLYLNESTFYIKFRGTRHVKSIDSFYGDEQNFFQVICKRVIQKYYKDIPQKENILRLIENDFELGLMLFKSRLYDYVGIEELKKEYDKLYKSYQADDRVREILSRKHNITKFAVGIYTTYF